MTDWTDAQLDAVTQRNKNLLISAGAGSGKTAVLTERIIRLITEDKTDTGRFLVLTFTKAAASQMKQRIRKELYKKIKTEQDKEFLFTQLNRLENAQISTIHSFCLNVIKKFYYVIDIDPASALLSEAESKILKQEALEHLFEEKYLEEDDAFIAFADMYSPGNDDGRIKEIILYFYMFIMNRPEPWQWLVDACEKLNLNNNNFIAHPAVGFLKKFAEQYINEAILNINEAKKLCRLYDGEGKRTAYMCDMEKSILSLKESFEENFERFIDEINAVSFAKYDMRKTCEKSDEIKIYRENAKEAVDTLKKTFGFSFAAYREQLRNLYPYMCKLADTVKEFGEIYSFLKHEKMSMDYNDLEHFCLAILKDDQAAQQIKAQYDHVFVDEYQDTNSIQEAIINKVANENALFIVGDIKQSIYRFREAEPDIFMARYQQYKNQQSDDAKLIFLNANFRTSSVIIDGINDVFSKIMFALTGGVDYYPDEMLTAGRQIPVSYKPEIHIIEQGAEETDQSIEEGSLIEELLDYKKQEAEAAYVAQLIKKLLDEEIYDESLQQPRQIRPCDIAVIGRSMRASADIYVEALRQAGISAASEKSGSYYDEMEIALIMNLLKVIDNTLNDIPLLAVMRSFLYRFNADELLEIRLSFKESMYYHEAVTQYAQNGGNDALKIKVNDMLNNFAFFRETSKHTSIETLLRKIYSATRITTFMSALSKGSQRQENLKYLLKLAAHYETTSFKGLYNFIQYFEKSKAHDSSFRINAQSENENTVKLMTVHKSKGLEFNVVILTGCASSFNLADTREDIILDKTLGICPVYYDMEKSFCCDSLAKTAVKLAIGQETAAEEMRILYVAATRAKQRLIFTGITKSAQTEKLLLNAAVPLTLLNIQQTNTYLGWLLKALLPEQRLQTLRDEKQFINDLWIIYLKQFSAQKESAFEQSKPIEELLPSIEDKNENYDKIAEILSYTYPHKEASSIPSKLSVSALKDAEQLTVGEKVIALQDAPRFMKTTGKFSAAQIGTYVHNVLLNLDMRSFDKQDIRKSIDEQMKAMVGKGVLNAQEMAAVQPELLIDFLQSDVGKLLLNADTLHKETPFIIKMDAEEINSEWEKTDETILIQGIIDCWFETGDKLILIDYKTDYTADPAKLQLLKQKYTHQINLYDRALKEIIGKSADEKYICFLTMKENILIQ